MTRNPSSKEGLHYQNNKVTQGLYTEAAIDSTKNLQHEYDVIVIGGGFTGLTAARDLSTAGKSVLIIEARDRIGGRTWATKAHGHYMEMGGTWVYWTQPHVWSELKRYGLDTELKQTTGTSPDLQALHFKTTQTSNFKRYTFDDCPSGYNAIMEATLYKFLDVDGAGGTKILSRPYDASLVSQIPTRFLKMTVKDRLDQLPDIPQEHKNLVASMFETIGVAPIEQTPFFEVLRWFGLSGWTFKGFLDSVDALSLKRGTTTLALAIMDESKADILLSAPVASVTRTQNSATTTITTRDGRKFLAPRIISTLPVNCLGDVVFDPPISPLKLAAAREQHLTKTVKMHTYTQETLTPSFVASLMPAKVAFGYTESDVPADHGGGTFSVFFGSEPNLDRSSPLATFQELEKILPDEFQTDLNPKFVPKEMFWHDWTNDEFAKGAWCTFPMGWQENYLDALREAEQGGKWIFANADWADGWRGFIDGAFEMGRVAAWRILREDKGKRQTSKL